MVVEARPQSVGSRPNRRDRGQGPKQARGSGRSSRAPLGWPPRYLTPVAESAIAAGDGADYLDFTDAYGVITKDSIAGPTGSPLALRDWQRQLYARTFARNPLTHRRLHRTAMWGMGRKNGKTGSVAPIAIKGLVLEGEGAEVYSCAADRDQAKLVFGAAKRTVELSPDLSARIRIFRDVLEDKSTGSIYRALSSEAFTKEGLSPTLVIADELHAWPNRDLYDVMALAMGARLDPLMLIVTTAGVMTDSSGRDTIAHTLYQYGRRIATGEIVDPSFFMAWWEAERGCTVDDPVAWSDANPGAGDILDIDELAGQARKALAGGMSESEFRIKRLNQWVVASTAALPSGSFEALAEPRDLDPKEPVVLFFDGSFNHDCTALVAVTLDGYLSTIDCWERPTDDPMWKVPIGAVDARVREACRDLNVVELACDPFRWAGQMEEWEAADLPVVKFPTSSPSQIVPAWATFYDAVLTGKLHHDGDPRLVRHVQNMTLKTDRLGPRPVKEHRGSGRSIDLGICAVGGYARAMWHASNQSEPVRPLVRWASR